MVDTTESYFGCEKIVEQAMAAITAGGSAILYVAGLESPILLKKIEHDRFVVIAHTATGYTYFFNHSAVVGVRCGN